MNPQFQFDVFLSHNSQDKPQVRQLAERLRDAGLKVWFDEWLIKPGDDIYLAIERGLETARVQLLCLSPAALASDWVSLERSTVLFRDPSNAGRRFVPLLLADCDLPDTLRRYKYVDFRGEAEAAFAEVLTVCKPEEAVMVAPSAGKAPRKKKPHRGKSQDVPEPLVVLERNLGGHTGWVNSIAVSPDGAWAASGAGEPDSDSDNTIKIWGLQTGTCLATLAGHTDQVRSVAITPDGKRFFSASADKSVRVWDVASGRERTKLEGHEDKVWSVVALPDNVRALSGGFDNTLRLWDTVSGLCLMVIYCGTDEGDSVFGVAVNRDGTQALSGHRDGRIRLWSLDSGDCLATLEGHTDVVYCLKFEPNGGFAVSGSEDKTVKVWDVTSAFCVGTLEGHEKSVDSLVLAPDGSLIASTGFQDYTVRLWDGQSGVCLQVIKHQVNDSPISAAFSPDGLRLLVGTTRGAIHVYRLTGRRPAISPEAPSRYVNAKVVLLGEGTVGKTSLAHRLIKDEYVVRDRTHGMNVWPLPLPPQGGALRAEKGEEREALLWDLAGQEEYRLIHRLFLEQTALGLLLINPQKDDPFAEAGDWLKALKTAATQHEPARLLVFSQVDVGEPKLGNAKIERFCQEQGFADWLLTSAKNGRNCSDEANGGQPSKLKQLIADSIPWDRLPWTSTPKLLASLKNAVMAMRDKTDIRLSQIVHLPFCKNLM